MPRPASVDQLLARVASNSTDLPPLQAQSSKVFDADATEDIERFADRACLRATLHLLNDDVERAHKVAQDDEGDMSSNLCHAILHRREGDFWNAKWWYSQIRHPLVQQIYGGTAQAKSFVDSVESIVGSKKGASATACAAGNLQQLKRRQADELAQLVAYTLDGR